MIGEEILIGGKYDNERTYRQFAAQRDLVCRSARRPDTCGGGRPSGRKRGCAPNMVRIGHAHLQGRPAYEPTAIQQGNRFILYVGHHQGNFLNPLTQAIEPDGTSIVDVTNPANPRQLFHIPGPPGGNQDNSMVRVCPGPYYTTDGPHGLPNATPGISTCCGYSGRKPMKSGTRPIHRSLYS